MPPHSKRIEGRLAISQLLCDGPQLLPDVPILDDAVLVRFTIDEARGVECGHPHDQAHKNSYDEPLQPHCGGLIFGWG